MKNSMVSVVMSVHDEKEEYLRQSIESILSQTYRNIEVIVVDDASSETCRLQLRNLLGDDPRVMVIHNEVNQGLTKSLNIAFTKAKGEYIARMDADDVSVPERIEKQVCYMESHPETDILGAGVVSFGVSSVFMSPAFGYSNDEAQANLFFSSTLCHPSVMIRRDFLDKHGLSYDERVKKGQDYDLWERASIFGRLSVMSDVLLYYRTHPAQITSTGSKEQSMTADMVRMRRLGRIGIAPSDREYRCHLLLTAGKDSSVAFGEIREWAERVLECNAKAGLVNQKTLRRCLSYRLTLCKMRNITYMRYVSWKDILNMFAIVKERIKAHRKLTAQQKEIEKYLR